VSLSFRLYVFQTKNDPAERMLSSMKELATKGLLGLQFLSYARESLFPVLGSESKGNFCADALMSHSG
jgi:hypothetical protein